MLILSISFLIQSGLNHQKSTYLLSFFDSYDNINHNYNIQKNRRKNICGYIGAYYQQLLVVLPQ